MDEHEESEAETEDGAETVAEADSDSEAESEAESETETETETGTGTGTESEAEADSEAESDDDDDLPYVGRLSAPELFHAGEVASAGASVLDSQESLAHVPDPNLAASLEMYSAMASDADEGDEEGAASAETAEAPSETTEAPAPEEAAEAGPAPIYGQPDAAPGAADLPEIPKPVKRDWVVFLIAVVPLLSCFSGIPLEVAGYRQIANRLPEEVAFPLLGTSLICGLICTIAVGMGRSRRTSWLAIAMAGTPWMLGCLWPRGGDVRLAAPQLGLFLSAVLFAFLSLAYGFLARRAKAEGRRWAAAFLGAMAVLPTLGYLVSRVTGGPAQGYGILFLGGVLTLGAALCAASIGEDEEERAAEHSFTGLLATLLALVALAEAMRSGNLWNVGMAARSGEPGPVMALIRRGAQFAGQHTWIPMAVLAPMGALVLLAPPLKKSRRAILVSLGLALILLSASYLTHPSLSRFAPGIRDPRAATLMEGR